MLVEEGSWFKSSASSPVVCPVRSALCTLLYPASRPMSTGIGSNPPSKEKLFDIYSSHVLGMTLARL